MAQSLLGSKQLHEFIINFDRCGNFQVTRDCLIKLLLKCINCSFPQCVGSSEEMLTSWQNFAL